MSASFERLRTLPGEGIALSVGRLNSELTRILSEHRRKNLRRVLIVMNTSSREARRVSFIYKELCTLPFPGCLEQTRSICKGNL